MQSQKRRNHLGLLPRKTIQDHSNPSLCPNYNAEEDEVEQLYKDLQDLLQLTPQKDVIVDWNAKVGCQEKSGVNGKFCLGIRNEAGQKLTDFAKRTLWS